MPKEEFGDQNKRREIMTEEQVKKNEPKKNPDKKINGNAPSQKQKSELSTAWFVVLFIYIFLFVGTGYLTFFYNNEYATNQENMLKITKDYGDQKKYELVQKWIERDNVNYNDVNKIASQAFNVVLGAILAFLAATASKKLDFSNKEGK
ncbi:MAG: hypothetical protein D3907_06495 [Candidatus Electrothrix sp. AUS3]|nr:hypothetical protein [Candidatus Electrothrix gigas]